jgi:general secretion pathway protein G
MRRGFTLLELLIVMALLALMSALVAPRLGNWVESSARRDGISSVRQQIESWPQQAFLAGQAMAWPPVPPASDPGLLLPEGWRLSAEPALRVASNGMNEAAVLELRNAKGELLARWQWLAPAGRLVDEPLPDAR